MPVVVRLLDLPPPDSEATTSEGCPQTPPHSSLKFSSPNPLITKEWELGISEGCSPAATDLIMAPHSLQLWCHLISLRLWITRQLAHTHTHVSTSFIWHSQEESFQDNWCLRTEEPLFNISAVLLESFETIIYYYFLAYFLKQRASNTDLFPSLVCWEVLCGSYCRLSSTCVETHLALYLGLLEDMFQVLVCQAWFIQSELVSPKKKKGPRVLTESSVKASMHKSYLGSLRPQGLSAGAGLVICPYSGWPCICGFPGLEDLRYRRHVQVSIETWLWRALARCPAWTQQLLLSPRPSSLICSFLLYYFCSTACSPTFLSLWLSGLAFFEQ